MDDLKERLRANGLDECDEAIDRIEALEKRIRLGDALADEMERLVSRTPFVPVPNGISVTIGIDQIADQRVALAAYRETDT